MKQHLFITITTLALCLFSIGGAALAQSSSGAGSDDLPRFEVGAHFTSLSFGTDRTEPGLGARFTYNLTRSFALEAEGDLLPHNSRFFNVRNGGRAAEGLFGVKFGKRFDKFGIFGKARPGLISFEHERGVHIATSTGGSPSFVSDTERVTHFATDIGGVLEFYPTRRIVTRLDAGDTIIRYRSYDFNSVSVAADGSIAVFPLRIPGETTHNFQFTAGVGFRF